MAKAGGVTVVAKPGTASGVNTASAPLWAWEEAERVWKTQAEAAKIFSVLPGEAKDVENSPSMTAQKADLWALGKKGDPASVEALARAAEHSPSKEVRLQAVIVLGEMADDAMWADATPGMVALIKKAAEGNEVSKPRIASINAWKEIAQAKAVEHSPSQVLAADDLVWVEGADGRRSLATVASVNRAGTITVNWDACGTRNLLRSQVASQQELIAEITAKKKGHKAEAQETAREADVWALGENGDAASVEALAGAGEHSPSMTAQKADLWALGKRGDAASVEALARAVEHSPSMSARKADLVSAASMEARARAGKVRTEAVIVLGEMMTDAKWAYKRRGMVLLTNKAADKNEDSPPRIAAINALKGIAQATDTPAKAAMDALRAVAADKRELLGPRIAAIRALYAIDPVAKSPKIILPRRRSMLRAARTCE